MQCYNCFKEKHNNEETCPNCGYTPRGEMDEHYYLPEGTVLNDRYKIGRVLGHGGFGITYLGYDERLEVIVAIKEYLPSEVATRALGEVTVTSFSGEKKEQYDYGLGRFLDEARTLARYNHHPCIVSTTDFFETNNTAYLVMEFLDGIPLNEYLKRKGGKISWEETLEIMMPVMDALREVHSSGMIHRDISPDNIYITKDGQVKLLDFGAARFALGEKSKSLSVVLKPGYAPPEQYYTRGKQGPWTDVYAVAATIYRMLTGEPMVEAMERNMDDEYRKPSELGVSIESDVEVALVKALEFRPENRWQKIKDFQWVLNESTSIEANCINNSFVEKDKKSKLLIKSKESVQEKVEVQRNLLSNRNEKKDGLLLNKSIISNSKNSNKNKYSSIWLVARMGMIILMIYGVIIFTNVLRISSVFIGMDEPIRSSFNALFQYEQENLYGLSITHIRLYGKNIEKVENLNRLQNIEMLDISYNNISTISGFQGLDNLETLWMSDNLITSLNDINELTNLKNLQLVNNNIRDISIISELNTLEVLYLNANEINEIEALESLSNLYVLGLNDNNVSNIDSIKSLTSLRQLEISNNDIKDIVALGEMSQLKWVYLIDNPITNSIENQQVLEVLEHQCHLLQYNPVE